MNAKRGPAATRIGGVATPGTAASTERGPRWVAWLGLAWLVAFCLFFYSFELPNNRPATRLDIWLSLFDFSIFTAPFEALWKNLGQRADIFGIAAVILAGAWGLGNLGLRLIVTDLFTGDTPGDTAERTFFVMAVGLGATSLLTLGLGLAGLLHRWLFIGFFALAVGAELAIRLRRGRRRKLDTSSPAATTKIAAHERPEIFWPAIAAIVAFLAVMSLGSMSPETDFDVRAYHFEGPKEYFLAGRITFLQHNVYTNFPFFTEMFALLGMVLHGDWYWGALAGKCVLFSFAPLTALGLYAAGRRWFNPTAGVVAALVYLSTPWIVRISIIAYAEGGLALYLLASLVAAMRSIDELQSQAERVNRRWIFLAGLLAGSGMACKYTGLMQVVLPVGGVLLAAPLFVMHPWPVRLRAVLTTAFFLGLGLAIAIGPWLLKNIAETGNPVYPLAYGLFGGTDLDPQLDAKFRAGHSATGGRTFSQHLLDVIADSDWSSPLLFGLAPLSLFAREGRRRAAWLWLFVGYLFFTWWAFTHRIDRFWVPMIPVVALLAGCGATWRREPVWRWGATAVVALAVWFNLGFVAGSQTADLTGYNAFLADIADARRIAENASLIYLHQTLPKDAKVLFVGEAEVFEARFPYVYNTVFDRSIFEEWFAGGSKGAPAETRTLKSRDEILATLHTQGITHVFVNWDWIRRYRAPNNYGYNKFVKPATFDQAVTAGVLSPPRSLGVLSADPQTLSAGEISRLQSGFRVPQQTADGREVIITGLSGRLSNEERATLNELGPSLLARVEGHDVLINSQLFAVR